jgi:hypothetical protein
MSNFSFPVPHVPSGPCSAAEDNTFSPVVQCKDFDFTLYFEQAIFGIGISGVWVIIFLLRLLVVPTKKVVARKSPLHVAKIVS